uniref:Dimer_Tnp_hAT domain-containing protein n=1 Tax=Strongyloides venezuelensis TaxID=75913 RepID=A0A0K0F3K3_STRVS
MDILKAEFLQSIKKEECVSKTKLEKLLSDFYSGDRSFPIDIEELHKILENIPSSSALIERVFSTTALQITKLKSRTSQDTLPAKLIVCLDK